MGAADELVEMLRDAAYAAGLAVVGFFDGIFLVRRPGSDPFRWEPQHDSGQALELATDLKMQLGQNGSVAVASYLCVGEPLRVVNVPHGDDKYQASRMAVLKLAALMGRHRNETSHAHNL
ncbi:hypothetical protein HNP46_004236 [Pseudomonas nitritireducens]|uniref:Uncharacterized protein n=1 Tax=Pseudomonas nitroreducens TaxID=46680 RepID=A0A7W7P3A0_PSENT|nr:hypothetical protein [Pseudomonas nitritireducens]MBB4865355.1 hypothetical protein [Pseudomonas nitritireducens]